MNALSDAGVEMALNFRVPPPQEYVPPPPAPPAPDEDVITQLECLGALKAQGLLTEEEFATQKAKLLGM